MNGEVAPGEIIKIFLGLVTISATGTITPLEEDPIIAATLFSEISYSAAFFAASALVWLSW